MENLIVRPHKFAKILGGILIGIAVLLMAVFWWLKTYGWFGFSFIFLLLGLLLVYSYKKEYIAFSDIDVLIAKPFRKTITCSYSQIKAFLIVPMKNQTQFVLAGTGGEQIATLDSALAGIEIGISILEKHGTKIIDIAQLIETNQSVDAYMPALTKIQKINVQNMVEMQKNAEAMQNDSAPFDVGKTKKRLRILKITLCLIVVLGFFVGGKALFCTCMISLLLVYGLYAKYYPYMYFESIRKKTQDDTLQIPFLAPIISLLVLVMAQEPFSFSLLSYFAFVLVVALILYLPFLLKIRFQAIQTRVARMISVFLAAIIIAYTISFPLNVLLTFETPVHTNVTVTDKEEIRGKHDNWYVYVDDGTQFSVTKSEYHEIRKGDSMRVCTRTSVFGFAYSTLHK